MKKISNAFLQTLCFIIVLGLTVQATAQDKKISKKDVPGAVISAFQKTYPNAKIKGYNTETEGRTTYYEIESVEGEKTIDALVLPDGTIYEIEEGLAVNDLPPQVLAAVNAKYPNGKITNAEKTTQSSTVTYDLQVITGKTKVSLTVDPSGKIIN